MQRLTLLLTAALTLSACNTIAGAGRDMQNAGAAIQIKAQQIPVAPRPAAAVPVPGTPGAAPVGLVRPIVPMTTAVAPVAPRPAPLLAAPAAPVAAYPGVRPVVAARPAVPVAPAPMARPVR